MQAGSFWNHDSCESVTNLAGELSRLHPAEIKALVSRMMGLTRFDYAEQGAL